MGDYAWLCAATVITCWLGYLLWWDYTFLRLPNALTVLPGAAAVGVLLVVEPKTLLPALAWAGMYATLAMVTGGVGGGDVKLAVPFGCWLAALGGLPTVLLAIALASGVTMAVGFLRGDHRRPHGPAMVLAVLVSTALVLMNAMPLRQ